MFSGYLAAAIITVWVVIGGYVFYVRGIEKKFRL